MAHALEQDLNHVLTRTGDLWEALRDQNIFITGGTGFVGAWLVQSLVWANERLGLNARATLLTRNPDRFRSKAPEAANHPSVQFLRGGITSFEFPERDFAFVIHAATGNFPEVEGTRRVLEFARTHGTRRFLFTSSGAVYGKQPADLTHIPEDYPGVEPYSPYGHAKRISEWLCLTHARQYEFAAAIARLFAFAGPYLPLDLNFAIGNFVADVLAGRPVRIAGNGTPYRSYLYAADLAIWLWTILIKGESTRPYNVGSGDAITIAQLAQAVVENTVPATRIEIACKAAPGVPAARYVPSVDRAGRELGLYPIIPLEEAIRRMYAWNRTVKS